MSDDVCWIKTDECAYDYLTDEVKNVICRDDGSLHRLYQSLLAWPHSMLPADQFYKAVLHSSDSPLGLYQSEFVATHVAILAKCTYAKAHHGENFLKAAPSRDEGESILLALEQGNIEAECLGPKMQAMAKYTRKLSLEPMEMSENDIADLRDAGLTEAEIVQLNQIAASFGYWVRMINGLGIQLGEETIGMPQPRIDAIISSQRKIPK